MQLAHLAATSAEIAATRSRIAKRGFIARTIVAAEPDEIELVVTYLSGRLRQRRTGVGWASLARIPEPAAEPSLSVGDVDAAFDAIARLAGAGSAAARSRAVEALFARGTDLEQRFLRGLVFDDVRQGALDALVQDGLAQAFGVPAASVQRAAMMLGSTPAAARLMATEGVAALAAVGLRVGQPVRPMLAASAPDVAAALDKTGLPAVVDAKLDGIRVQVHRDGPVVRVYTRSLDDITARVPEIVATIAALPVDTVVLDGEALSLGPDGRPALFQVIAARAASHVDPVNGPGHPPLSLFCFDLLHIDGRDLLDEPLSERIAVMAAVLPAELVVPRRVSAADSDVVQAFADAVAAGYEGVLVKKLQAPYAAGRRDSGWVKLKPRHTFDLAVTAAEWGYGRREGWLSNLHLAARDPRNGALVMLGKTFKGLTDQILSWQTEQFLARESRRTRSTVYVDPPLVVEIACDGVQNSVRYPGGVALRFARVLRYRPDKTLDEIDTIDTMVALGRPADRGLTGSGADGIGADGIGADGIGG